MLFLDLFDVEFQRKYWWGPRSHEVLGAGVGVGWGWGCGVGGGAGLGEGDGDYTNAAGLPLPPERDF